MLDRALDDGKPEGRWYAAVSLVEAEEAAWDFQKHIFVQSTGDGGVASLLRQVDGKIMKLWKEQPIHEEEFKENGDWTGVPPRVTDNASRELKQENNEGGDVLKAQCHCGGISFSISRPSGPETWSEIDPSLIPTDRNKYYALHDMCNTCRLTSSSCIVAWFFPARASITIAPPWPPHASYPDDGLFGTAKLYESSEGMKRTFCGVCGATVSYWCSERKDMVDFAVGLLQGGDVRREDWLEWRVGKVAWEEDAVWKGVLEGLKSGLLGHVGGEGSKETADRRERERL